MNARLLPTVVLCAVAGLCFGIQIGRGLHPRPSRMQPRTLIPEAQATYLYRLGFYPREAHGRWEVLQTINGAPAGSVVSIDQAVAEHQARADAQAIADLYGLPITYLIHREQNGMGFTPQGKAQTLVDSPDGSPVVYYSGRPVGVAFGYGVVVRVRH